MSGIVVNTSALAAARAYLQTCSGPVQQQDGHSDDHPSSTAAKADDDNAPVARPPRLGLGAKWTDARSGTTTGLGVAAIGGRRLAASLKVESYHNKHDSDNDDENGDDDDDDEDSRARVTSGSTSAARKKRRRRKKNAALTSNKAIESKADEQEFLPDNVTVHESNVKVDPDMRDDTATNNERFDTFSGKATSPGLGLSSGMEPGGGVEKKKWKKKKIRSRQKNLRRDKRPKHLLPAHLTEETLLGGRVVRPVTASAPASVFADAGSTAGPGAASKADEAV